MATLPSEEHVTFCSIAMTLPNAMRYGIHVPYYT